MWRPRRTSASRCYGQEYACKVSTTERWAGRSAREVQYQRIQGLDVKAHNSVSHSTGTTAPFFCPISLYVQRPSFPLAINPTSPRRPHGFKSYCLGAPATALIHYGAYALAIANQLPSYLSDSLPCDHSRHQTGLMTSLTRLAAPFFRRHHPSARSGSANSSKGSFKRLSPRHILVSLGLRSSCVRGKVRGDERE